MEVQMMHSLSAFFSRIDNKTETVSSNPQLLSQFWHQSCHSAQHFCFCPFIQQRTNMLFGDQQHMGWGNRINIPESQKVIIFIYCITRDLMLGDLTENTVRQS